MRSGFAAMLLTGASLEACSDHRAPVAAPAQSVPAEATAAPVGSSPTDGSPDASASALLAETPAVGGGAALDGDAGAAATTERRPCPEGMALVQRFCIDRWEAELIATDTDAGLLVLPHNKPPPSDVRFEARSLADVMPQAYINRIDASAACRNAGKRLCSMQEWRRACEGRSGAHWPYGRHAVAGKCNHEKAHLLSMRYGSNPRRWTYDAFNDPALDVEPGFLAKTGAYDGCATPEDVHDLVGNLHEWVSDTVDAALVEKLEAEDVERKSQPWREGNGVFMGGFFSTADQHGPGCTFTTIAHEPAYHDYSVGFRCCAAADLPSPPPKVRKKRR
jgi:hypothetical protein